MVSSFFTLGVLTVHGRGKETLICTQFQQALFGQEDCYGLDS